MINTRTRSFVRSFAAALVRPRSLVLNNLNTMDIQ